MSHCSRWTPTTCHFINADDVLMCHVDSIQYGSYPKEVMERHLVFWLQKVITRGKFVN